ncbi:MAG TPA: MBL fold metallo-hydrolase [Thermoanaerobaculia bacterium]|nr:MBL fold metallo-hydrolase [Thermoanaerobaculia bacterium]
MAKKATVKKPKTAAAKKAAAKKAAAKKKSGAGQLRVRMYRVGFGDFFLFTVPSKAGPQHILIDCGVTKGKTGTGDIGTIKAAVTHMVQETGGKLALIIVTHRHMDHIIGFSRCPEFASLQVEAIWMPIWETEYEEDNQKFGIDFKDFQAQMTALAMDAGMHLALAADDNPDRAELLAMLENATGADFTPGGAFGAAGTGGGTNAASLRLLKEGMGVKPTYYHAGQKAKLPKSLVDAGLEAEILGPPPVDELAFMKLKDLKKGVGQFLNASERRADGDGGGGDGGTGNLRPFAERFSASADDYPPSAFREWAPRQPGMPPTIDPKARYAEALQKAVDDAQPEVLLTAIKQLDGFLNNQSLVVLFTFRGKKLLFAGDAQAGNWEYWLYDADAPVKAPEGELGEQGAQVLGHLDFYKVGHHGSTNATPIAAVEAMKGAHGFVSMCSTQHGAFGSEANESEVPRDPLMKALAAKSVLVRSDQVPLDHEGTKVPAVPGSPKKLGAPKQGKLEVGSCFVDYLL